jgi:hypothetical protein
LTPQGQIIARLVEAGIPLNKDFLFGPARELFYFVWKVDKELENRSYRLKITAVGLEDSKIVPFNPPLEKTSDLFFIGPAISNRS